MRRGELCLGTVDSWLLWNLTGGGPCRDLTNASRTQLLNLHTDAWDPELLDLFGIPAAALPEARPSARAARDDRRHGAAARRPAGRRGSSGIHTQPFSAMPDSLPASSRRPMAPDHR